MLFQKSLENVSCTNGETAPEAVGHCTLPQNQHNALLERDDILHATQ